MHVVIVGAGEVGWYLAQRLGAEGNDVVVVEQNEVIAAAIGAELDVQVVVGNAAVPSTLRAAGIEKAGLLAGVTQNDEVNLLASLLAKEFGVEQTVVRIQTEELRGPLGERLLETMGADVIIDPDADTADEIMELAHVSGADEVYPMSNGDLLVLGAVIGESSAFIGHDLAEIGRSFEPNWKFLFGALTRDGETVIPRGDQVLEAGDHVRVLTTRGARREILELLGAATRQARRVMVLGGGAVGTRVAERLQGEGATVVLVENDPVRAKALSQRLPRVTIVQGDIADTELLLEESVARMDLVIAATGDDASNVLACAYAAAEGEAFTVAVLHRLSLLPLVRQFGIDAALSPRTASANAVLRHIRGGTASVATFLESDVEVNEFEIEAGSSADGTLVADLHLRHSVLLGAVTRQDGTAEIVRGHTLLHAGDNVVVFSRPYVPAVTRKAFSGVTLPIRSTGRVSWFGTRGERLLSPGRYSSLVANVVGLTIAVVGVGIAASGIVDAIDGGPDVLVLVATGVAVWAVGSVMWRVTIVPKQIRILDVFTTVTLAWIAMALAGAIPYLLTGHFDRIDDAVFESISGFTTTGATVTPDIEATSQGLLFWRSTTQWMGGMGVIVLVVAVLPTVGSGGMSLLAAEAPGPTGERLTPRVRETARRLWAVYVGFTIVLAVLYAAAGMSLYDAVSHSFTTVSTGGFSPYQNSIGAFDSALIEWICILAMLLAGGSFTLYYRALKRDPKPLLRSSEFRFYLLMVAGVTLWAFVASGSDGGQAAGFRDALFTTASMVTTTGYVTTEYGLWSQTTQLVLLFLMPIGAMAGSTAGGVKLVRVMAIASFAHREALRHLHPHLVRPVRVGSGILPDDVARRVVGFMIMALAIFGGGAVLISATGPDMITSLSSSATAFGNVGPGLGSLDHANDFLSIPAPGRAVAMGQMLLGRLEIFPVILALSVITLRIPKALHTRRRSD